MNRKPFDPSKIRPAAAEDGELLHKELTHHVIGAAMRVHRELGPGFPEPIYREAMKVDLANCGLRYEYERVQEVFYMRQVVGRFRFDIIVEAKVLLELKAVEKIIPLFRQQTLSYLKASGIRVGLLINFGEPSLRYQRFVC
jgi:GxxExxY protein